MIFDKIKKIIQCFRYFKNPLVVLRFWRGHFIKGQKVKIFPKHSPTFFVARQGDSWIIDKILRGEKVLVASNSAGQNYIIQDDLYLRQGTSDTFVYKEIFIDECYRDWIDGLTKDSIVIDLGAHIGLFSLSCAKRCGKIFAYEAHPSNFNLAQKNITNRRANNIKLFNLAAWSKSDEIVRLDGEETVQTGEYKVKNSGSLAIKTISLIDIFTQNNINHCDLLKVDIEGAEYEVLLSAPSEVWSKIKSICLECHSDLVNNRTAKDLKKFLQEKGFKVGKKEIRDSLDFMWAWK